MVDALSSLPAEPLALDTVLAMADTYEYAMRAGSEEVLAMLVFRDERAVLVGYDPDAGGWVRVAVGEAESIGDDTGDVDDALAVWLDATHGEDGEAVTAGDRKRNRASEAVEMGMVSAYDCPECDYYATGETTTVHAYLHHLQAEHDYSQQEAHDLVRE